MKIDSRRMNFHFPINVYYKISFSVLEESFFVFEGRLLLQRYQMWFRWKCCAEFQINIRYIEQNHKFSFYLDCLLITQTLYFRRSYQLGSYPSLNC